MPIRRSRHGRLREGGLPSAPSAGDPLYVELCLELLVADEDLVGLRAQLAQPRHFLVERTALVRSGRDRPEGPGVDHLAAAVLPRWPDSYA